MRYRDPAEASEIRLGHCPFCHLPTFPQGLETGLDLFAIKVTTNRRKMIAVVHTVDIAAHRRAAYIRFTTDLAPGDRNTPRRMFAVCALGAETTRAQAVRRQI